jgi:flagellar basal-body rod protein FlgB
MQVGFLDFYGSVLDVAQDVPFDAAMSAELTPGPDTIAAAAPEYRADDTVALDGNDVAPDNERLEAAQNGERMIGATTFLHQSTADLVAALRPNPSGV